MPRGGCDCHVHVFGPFDRFALAAERRYTPGAARLRDLVAHQRALRLDRVVIVQPSPYGTDNACLLDALHHLGDAARGVAVIDAATPDTVLAQMHAAGVRGVRLNLATGGVRDPALARAALQATAARVAPLGWHVQIYAELALLDALAATLAALPVPVVIDHFGRPVAEAGREQPGVAALCALLRGGRIYVKLSAPYLISDAPDYADAAPLARLLAAANPARVLFGSNWPHPAGRRGATPQPGIEPFRPEDDGMALRRLAGWLGDDAALWRLLLVDNPARLYGFTLPPHAAG